jgi:hypothetical protein
VLCAGASSGEVHPAGARLLLRAKGARRRPGEKGKESGLRDWLLHVRSGASALQSKKMAPLDGLGSIREPSVTDDVLQELRKIVYQKT